MIKIHTDGGCSVHKSKSGSWAFALSKEEFRRGKESHTTNNRMELQAIIEAILYVKSTYDPQPIEIISDSKYCVDGFTSWMHGWKKRGWKKKKGDILNLDQWTLLYELRTDVTLKWVKGHADDDMNNFVDSLCSN